MRDRFPLLLVGFVLFLAVLGTFVLQGARRGSFADRLSTFRSEPDGARALYLVLEQQGLHVRRGKASLEHLEPGVSLVLLGVRADDEGSKDKAAFDGSDGGVAPSDQEKDDEELDELKERGLSALGVPRLSSEERDQLLERVSEGATVVYVPWGWRDNPLLAALGVSLVKADPKLELRTLVPSQPSRFTRGVERVETPVQAFLELPAGAVPILEDEQLEQPVAALVRHGQGQVIVLGAPELAMNKRLALADNARFWSTLAAEAGRAHPLVFDEFHHGFTGEPSMGEFAARYGLQYAVGQLLLGLAFWALALRRFGRQRDPVKELRVGATDALAATSRIYREGRHHPHAADVIVRELAVELAGKAGVSGRSTPAEIGAALEVRGRKDLAKALLELSSTAARTTTDAELQHLARLAALARRTLHQPQRKTP